jgi:ornithine cyclodeaminase/alanine dehydrogenase-like protein (mu-crystallin family)
MSPLYLTEADVRATLAVAPCIDLLDAAARAQVDGGAENKPRQRVFGDGVMMHVLPAAYGAFAGHKTYSVGAPRGARFWYTLFGTGGEWLALIEADGLGQIRTGAASGLATRVMARADAHDLAVIGTGWQARTQLEAVLAARTIDRIRVYGRDRDRLERFCAEMSELAKLDVEPSASAKDCVTGADIVCTMTNAMTPVFEGSWLAEGAHVNAAGSNRANAQEIDIETVHRAAIVAVEDVAQAKVESGDLRSANEAGTWHWDDATRLADIVAGAAIGRTSDDQITLFESLGIGLWDLAAARHVYAHAGERGTRMSIPG